MLPPDIAKDTHFFYAAENGASIREFKFARWVGASMWYVHTTTGHQPRNERCFLERKDAVEYCVKKLRELIRDLEQSVEVTSPAQ